MISTYVRDEAYFLQIDSHMRFDAGWDVTLVDALESLNRTSPRSIISTYPCAFELIDNEVVKKPMSDQTPVLGFYALPTKSEVILPGHHVGAGCLFSRASLLREVPIDPWLYFHGEEQNLAVRAWTHGWDIWHMPDMPIFHRYHDGGGRPVHWNEADDRQRSERWWELDRQANARMRALLYDRVPLGCYGLGSARSLEDFARASGLDYPARAVR
jgi:GT2 family glycosyltransferase